MLVKSYKTKVDFMSLFSVSFGNNSVISNVRIGQVFFGFRFSDVSAIFCFVSFSLLETFTVLQGSSLDHFKEIYANSNICWHKQKQDEKKCRKSGKNVMWQKKLFRRFFFPNFLNSCQLVSSHSLFRSILFRDFCMKWINKFEWNKAKILWLNFNVGIFSSSLFGILSYLRSWCLVKRQKFSWNQMNCCIVLIS